MASILWFEIPYFSGQSLNFLLILFLFSLPIYILSTLVHIGISRRIKLHIQINIPFYLLLRIRFLFTQTFIQLLCLPDQPLYLYFHLPNNLIFLIDKWHQVCYLFPIKLMLLDPQHQIILYFTILCILLLGNILDLDCYKFVLNISTFIGQLLTEELFCFNYYNKLHKGFIIF